MTVTDLSEPYDPPAERDGARSRGAWLVLGTWLLCGGGIGTAIGATLQITGHLPGGAGTVGVFSILLFGVLGGLALRVERQHAVRRPEILDSRGRHGKPVHGGLFVLPIAVTVPALLWLAVVGSVATETLVPALAFGMLAFALSWGGLRAWASHRLVSALEAVELGRLDDARGILLALQGQATAGAGVRATARLDLGWLSLQQGDLDEAARWYTEAQRGRAIAHASAGLALVHLLQDRLDAANDALRRALQSPDARQVQGQIDAVRLLLLWRTEGEAEARAFGERMITEEASFLFRGLLGVLRRRADDPAADDLLAGVRGPLVASGLAGLVPELAILER